MQDEHCSAHFSDYTKTTENKMHLLTSVSWIEHPELCQCSPEHRATTVLLCWAHSCFLQLTRQRRRWQAVMPGQSHSSLNSRYITRHDITLQCNVGSCWDTVSEAILMRMSGLPWEKANMLWDSSVSCKGFLVLWKWTNYSPRIINCYMALRRSKEIRSQSETGHRMMYNTQHLHIYKYIFT